MTDGEVCVTCGRSDSSRYCRGLCRPCYDKDLKVRNPRYAERQRENNRKWREKNVEHLQAYHRAYVNRNAVEVNRRKRALRRGLKPNVYEEIVAKPCGICTTVERRRYVDHDHQTGRIRGPLCHSCNLAVGHVDKHRGRRPPHSRKPEWWMDRALTWVSGTVDYREEAIA